VGHLAPWSIHLRRRASSCGDKGSFRKGIRGSWIPLTRRKRRLSPLDPGTRAGPLAPPFKTSVRVWRESPPCSNRALWQEWHRSWRMDWTWMASSDEPDWPMDGTWIKEATARTTTPQGQFPIRVLEIRISQDESTPPARFVGKARFPPGGTAMRPGSRPVPGFGSATAPGGGSSGGSGPRPPGRAAADPGPVESVRRDPP